MPPRRGPHAVPFSCVSFINRWRFNQRGLLGYGTEDGSLTFLDVTRDKVQRAAQYLSSQQYHHTVFVFEIISLSRCLVKVKARLWMFNGIRSPQPTFLPHSPLVTPNLDEILPTV